MKKKGKIAFISLSVATLLSLFLISGTFAKYISAIDIADEARVAKWGVNVVQKVDLFKDSYTKGEDDHEYVKSLSECAKGTEDREYDEENPCYKVIAPGTSGEYRFKITGTPETNYFLAIDIMASEDTVGRIWYQFDNLKKTMNIKELANQIESIYSPDNVYSAGTPIDETEHIIRWWWEFEESDINVNDKADTIKGENAIINPGETIEITKEDGSTQTLKYAGDVTIDEDGNKIIENKQATVYFTIKVRAEQTTKEVTVPTN